MTMPSMASIKFGHVVLIAFPITNLQPVKKIPAVVINSQAYQNKRDSFILIAITNYQTGYTAV